MEKIDNYFYEPGGRTLFVFFDTYDKCQGIGDASEYEIFEDMDLADQKGIHKIVGIDILNMEKFDPDNVPELTDDQRALVKELFNKFK